MARSLAGVGCRLAAADCRLAPPPPQFFGKTNPTSPLESIKRCKNEPKTNPNEPNSADFGRCISPLEQAVAVLARGTVCCLTCASSQLQSARRCGARFRAGSLAKPRRSEDSHSRQGAVDLTKRWTSAVGPFLGLVSRRRQRRPLEPVKAYPAPSRVRRAGNMPGPATARLPGTLAGPAAGAEELSNAFR